MKARGKRPVRRPPDLTSLFDVLFIVVFVALIRAAAAQQEVQRLTPPPPPPPTPAPPSPPPPPPDVALLRAQALAGLERDLAGRTPLVVRISTQVERDRVKGTVASIEHEGQELALDVPLLADSRDPDIEVEYLGERSAELRVCRIAAVHLRLPDLARHLVIIVPDRPYADLRRAAGSWALFEGLKNDAFRCFTEQRGMASLVDPGELQPADPAPAQPASPADPAPAQSADPEPPSPP
jgi:hypothetical protein